MNSNEGVTMSAKYGVNESGEFFYEGMGTFANEAEFVIKFNAELREMGISANYTSAEDVATRGTKPLGTGGDVPADVEAVRTRFAQPGQRCGRGVVRRVSDAQIKFMIKLLNERNYRQLIGMKWWPATAVDHASTIEAVKVISLKGASTMIDGLLACPKRAHVVEEEANSGEPMATSAQLGYLSTLLNEREHEFTGEVAELTKREASDLIRLLKTAARKAITTGKNLPTTVEEIKELAGLWQMADGTIYRMKKARSGNHFYAELLTDADTGAFEYAPGMAHKVPAQGRKMTLEECEALSALMGACCMCSRTLTATVNGVGPAARFIGPRCSANMGL